MMLDVEAAVLDRYARGARERQEDLCCPVTYERSDLLAVIPSEILERDYGCGDPSAFVREGETVLDLGCGAGKLCYIAAQIVGPQGKVIGVDFNPEMLALARRHQQTVAEALGYANVEFRRGRIQDLSLDLERLDAYLRRHPVRALEDWERLRAWEAASRRKSPMIADRSVDVVVSNCVLNLVSPEDRKRLFGEIYRVLRDGGRAVISDIVADEAVPEELRADPELWSGCISGAFQEEEFLRAFERAGFYGMEIVRRQQRPWRVVEGIEFRSMTVIAYKGKEGPCWDCNQAVIYRGPWKRVEDDDGHILERGVPTAVCEKTFRIYSREPYGASVISVPPRVPVPVEEARPFDCSRDRRRSPRETKGEQYRETTATDEPCCGPVDGGEACC